jgi:hypothetical protein
MADVDAILCDSRLTTGACVAIYDRAFSALYHFADANCYDELLRAR